ncbi:MAG: gliding motility-associated C-terminal domain-containing protein [Chitinophagales bacterium]|nr:gliding motility-associated C-terminal domain-containing protein [Chitinophagales bacterium]
MKGCIPNRLLLLLLCCTSLFGATAQDKSNKGKEFWLGYGYCWNFTSEAPLNTQELVLYLSAEAPATVTVSIANTSWSQTVNIPANTVDASILIPKTGADDARIFVEGQTNRAIHIVSDTPIVVYAHTYNGMISAATMLMPVETYGFLYYSLNYSQAQSGSSPPLPPINTTQNGPDWYSWFYVIASEDNTRLQITPADTTRNGWLPNQTYTVNLNKGEIYTVMGKLGSGNLDWAASKDMTGSKVVAVQGADGNCHPFALFSGSSGIRLCKNDGGENMQQQVFPTQAWGTRYLTYHTLNNTATDINDPFKNFYRVAVADPTTIVKRNGVPLTGLTRNFYYEFLDSTGGDYIEADKPVLVAQYTPGGNRCYLASQFAYGDPEMFYLSPVEQGKKDVLFYATRKQNIDYNYLNVIVPTAGLGSLRLDGNPFDPVNIKTHPNNPAFSVAVARITGAAAQHRLVCDSTFTATVYGLGFFESYGYNVGTNINNLNNYSAIRNTLNSSGNIDTFTCKNTPVRLFVKLAYPATSIRWRFSQVSGITPNADSVINSPVLLNTESINGRTYYVYSLQQDFTFAAPGTYIIPVSYTAALIPNCNQTEYATVTVVVKQGPKADFTFSSACPNQSITFTGASTTTGFNMAGYLWNFPDGTTQTTVNASKAFPAIGTYNVRYRIYADNGCIGDTNKPVSVGNPVSLSVQASGKACADSLFTFTSSIPANSANPPSWYWDFGDGNNTVISSGNTATHGYAANAGPIQVRHAVGFSTGCGTDTVLYSIPVIHANPVASFSFVADTLCELKPVQFNATLTGISSWAWNFGDGTSTAAPPLTHTFGKPGSYPVTLIVQDVNGCGSQPAVNTVIINPMPDIDAGPDKFFRIGSSVTLDASISNPGNYDFVWTPGTYLNTTTLLNPTALTDRRMTYYITATDKATHCANTDSMVIKPISIVQVPNAFTPNNDGKNDLFRVLGTELVTRFNLRIFDRYGQLVFETNDKGQGWDGKRKGTDLPTGGFVYILTYSAPNYPAAQVEKGSFILIR